MALSDIQVRNLKPKDKPYKISDEKGLCLLVKKVKAKPGVSKLWYLAYRFEGKQKDLPLGSYPAVSIAEARRARDKARLTLKNGIDPALKKKQDALEAPQMKMNTFHVVASDYLAWLRENGRAAATLKKNEWFLSLLEPIRERPIREITPRDLRDLLRKIAASGRHDTAISLRGFVSSVYRHAILDDLVDSDPSFPLRRTLKPATVRHRAAIIKPDDFGGLLRAVEEYDGQPTTHAALKLTAYLFPRRGELRHAEWREFDLDNAVWTIPAARTKMRREHRVPLPSEAVAILRDLKVVTGCGRLVFPGLRSPNRPISENTLNAGLHRLGFSKDQATAHGFRATASTLLNESGKWNADAIERQLAHVEGSKVRKAYQRGEFWEERVRMMNWWADYVDVLRDGCKVTISPNQLLSGSPTSASASAFQQQASNDTATILASLEFGHILPVTRLRG